MQNSIAPVEREGAPANGSIPQGCFRQAHSTPELPFLTSSHFLKDFRQHSSQNDLSLLYQDLAQPIIDAHQHTHMDYLPNIPALDPCYQPAQEPIDFQSNNCLPPDYQGHPVLDQGYCYAAPGIDEVDLQLGKLCHANTISGHCRAACGSQSVDSDGTVAGRLSRPSSSEVAQDYKGSSEQW